MQKKHLRISQKTYIYLLRLAEVEKLVCIDKNKMQNPDLEYNYMKHVSMWRKQLEN